MKRTHLFAALLVVGVAAGVLWVTQDTGPSPVVYTVVRGDTLWKIAKKHDVSVDQIREWNGLSGDRIDVGQTLELYLEAPPEGGPTAAPARRRTVTSRGGAVQPSATPPAEGTLQPPAPKPCLAGPSADDLDNNGDEAAFAASAGLSEAQISTAMNGFLPTLSRCLVPGEPTQGVLLLDITVACSGVVSGVDVLDDDGLPAGVVSCVPKTLRAAPFPAHDMPDGMTFRYPMRFSGP